MKRALWFTGLMAMVLAGWPAASARGQQTVAESLSVMDERLSKLKAQYDDIQFRQQKMQEQLDDLQAQINQLRKTAGGVSAGDLQALDDRIRAVDAAREKDKKAIVDQLAKELAAISAGRSGAKATGPAGGPGPSEGREHVVQKGETLTAIAKACGVSVEDLKKTNNLSNPDDLKPGQKLVIPK